MPVSRLRPLLLLLPAAALAAPVDFVREVRPIFEQHCYDCHGDTKQKSGLRLDIKSEALRGGDNHGPDILPGKAKGFRVRDLAAAKAWLADGPDS